MCQFMATTTPPSLAAAPGGSALITRDRHVLQRGQAGVRQQLRVVPLGRGAVERHHPSGGRDRHQQLPQQDARTGKRGTSGPQFSSDQYKERPTGGPGYYRDVPLIGVWATAPFFHNNRLGVYNQDPSVAGRVAAYEEAMGELLNPLSRDILGSIQKTTAPITVSALGLSLTLPTGTPVALFANLDPANPLHNLCPDLAENQGHYYGALPLVVGQVRPHRVAQDPVIPA